MSARHKLENHIVAISLHFMYYNFSRIHQTLRITPAMAAGVTDRAWDVEDIVNLLEKSEQQSKAAKSEQQYAWKGPTLGH